MSLIYPHDLTWIFHEFTQICSEDSWQTCIILPQHSLAHLKKRKYLWPDLLLRIFYLSIREKISSNPFHRLQFTITIQLYFFKPKVPDFALSDTWQDNPGLARKTFQIHGRTRCFSEYKCPLATSWLSWRTCLENDTLQLYCTQAISPRRQLEKWLQSL